MFISANDEKNQLKLNYLLSYLIVFLLLLFLASLVTEKYFAKGYVHFLMLIGFGFIIYSNLNKRLFSTSEESLIRFSVLAYLLVLTGFFFQNPDYTRFGRALETQAAHLIPLLLFPILYAVRRYITIEFLAWCLILAALTSFFVTVIAYFEGFLVAGHRGGGQVHGAPIIYGNLSMLFGVLSIAMSLYFYSQEKIYFYFLILGAVLAILSSLFSGTRGGWIVLFTLPFFLIPAWGFKSAWRYILSYLFILTLISIFIYFNVSSIGSRIDALFEELRLLVNDSSYAGGSLGSRLVFWEMSFKAFISSPIIGIGAGEFYSFLQHQHQLGFLPENLIDFKHAHNEYLSILSSYGLVGVFLYLTFLIWLLRLFKSYLNRSSREVRIFGLLGIVTIFCYLEFSLTESFLTSQLGLPAFYFITGMLIFLAEKYHKGLK